LSDFGTLRKEYSLDFLLYFFIKKKVKKGLKSEKRFLAKLNFTFLHKELNLIWLAKFVLKPLEFGFLKSKIKMMFFFEVKVVRIGQIRI